MDVSGIKVCGLFSVIFRVFDAQAAFDVYQSQRDDITMREDPSVVPFTLDDGFGKCLCFMCTKFDQLFYLCI